MNVCIKNIYTLVLFGSLFIFSCGKSVPIENAEKEFSFYISNPEIREKNKIDYYKTAAGIMIKKKTNVSLDIRYYNGDDPRADAYYMTATESYPDIIYSYKSLDIYLDAGAFIPLNDLIDQYGPNIKKYYGSLLNIFADDNGIIYYLGSNYTIDNVDYPKTGFFLSIELLRENGWPRIRSFEEYIACLRAYVKNHPTFDGEPVIGFSTVTAGNKLDTLTLGAAKLMGYPDMGDVYPVTEYPLKIDLIVRSDFAKKYFRILNGLWEEGLLDKALFAQNKDVYLNKIASGRVAAFFDFYWHVYPAIDTLIEKGLYDKNVIPFPVLFKEAAGDSYALTKEIYYSEGTGISIQCKDPVGVIKFWNRMLDDDIQKLIYWGMEKVHYYTVKGVMKKSPNQFRTLWVPENGLMRFTRGFPQRDQRSFFEDGNPLTPLVLPGYAEYNRPGYMREVMKAYNINRILDLFGSPKAVPLGLGNIPVHERTAKIESIIKNLEEVTRDHLAVIISSPPSDFDLLWEHFQSTLEMIDIDVYLNYRTGIYKKLQEKLKG